MENNKKQETINISRRMFLKLGFWITGLASAWGALRFLSYETPQDTLAPFITMDKPNSYTNGSMTYAQEVKAWLIHDKKGFYSISAICTHLGCTVNEKEGQFICPCHESKYEKSGKVIQGPATKNLPHFEVYLSKNNQIVINREKEVSPSQRLNN